MYVYNILSECYIHVHVRTCIRITYSRKVGVQGEQEGVVVPLTRGALGVGGHASRDPLPWEGGLEGALTSSLGGLQGPQVQ